jgi:RNA polymerase sigma factor (sigma-70 family)
VNPGNVGGRSFQTTRWSLILAAADPQSSTAEAALASLCEMYWLPVYAFVRRTGASTEDARDLTQAFFTRVLEKGFFGQARQERGRFRSFLFAAVRHFLANEREAERARKRGGEQTRHSVEIESEGERLVQLELHENLTPEHVFERRWALLVLDHALARLAAKYVGPERQQTFTVLKTFLGGQNLESHAAAAASLGVAEGSFRVTLHRFRKQFAACLRDVVSDTVERPEDVDEELQYLLRVVSRS